MADGVVLSERCNGMDPSRTLHCKKAPLPGMVVCADHATPEATHYLAHEVAQLRAALARAEGEREEAERCIETQRAEIASCHAEIEEWQTASGLCVPSEEQGGDPGGVEPRHLAEYLAGYDERTRKLIEELNEVEEDRRRWRSLADQNAEHADAAMRHNVALHDGITRICAGAIPADLKCYLLRLLVPGGEVMGYEYDVFREVAERIDAGKGTAADAMAYLGGSYLCNLGDIPSKAIGILASSLAAALKERGEVAGAVKAEVARLEEIVQKSHRCHPYPDTCESCGRERLAEDVIDALRAALAGKEGANG